jgi:hypothetical protein
MSVRARSRAARDFLTILLVSAIVLVPAMARVYQRATVQSTRGHEGSSFSHSSDSAPNKITSVCTLSLVSHLTVHSLDITTARWDAVITNVDPVPILFVSTDHSFRGPPAPVPA